MKLVRPHIPVTVRLEVIARQLQERGKLYDVLTVAALTMSPSDRLAYLLKCAFGEEKLHLDHDPPLCLREIIDAEKGLYQPDANDPRYLVYRTAEEHRVKTFVRGDGAQHSDAAKRRKESRRRKLLTIAVNYATERLKGTPAEGTPEEILADFLEVERRRKRAGFPPSLPSRWPPKGSRPLRGRVR